MERGRSGDKGLGRDQKSVLKKKQTQAIWRRWPLSTLQEALERTPTPSDCCNHILSAEARSWFGSVGCAAWECFSFPSEWQPEAAKHISSRRLKGRSATISLGAGKLLPPFPPQCTSYRKSTWQTGPPKQATRGARSPDGAATYVPTTRLAPSSTSRLRSASPVRKRSPRAHTSTTCCAFSSRRRWPPAMSPGTLGLGRLLGLRWARPALEGAGRQGCSHQPRGRGGAGAPRLGVPWLPGMRASPPPSRGQWEYKDKNAD